MRTHLITSRGPRIRRPASGGWSALLTIAALAIGALCSSGCYPRSPVGHFGDQAFYQTTWQYRIRYGEVPHRLLPERWELVNFHVDESGRPTQAQLDVTGMVRYPRGRPFRRPVPPLEVPALDLLFRQREGTSRIWVRRAVVPEMGWHALVPDARWGASPEIWMHAFVTEIFRGGDALGPRDPVGLTHVVARGEARVDGQAAYWVQFEGRRENTPERITLVGVPPRILRMEGQSQPVPTLVVFGFASSPEDHEEVRRDFESMVARVDLGRGR